MPDWKPALTTRLARLALGPERERDIIDELSQHLDDRYRELCLEGRSHEDAVRLALEEVEDGDCLAREMRGLRQAAVRTRPARGAPAASAWGGLRQDIAYALQGVRRSPAFAAAVILTLAVGIGANSAIFSLVNATLLQRLPVANRDRLVHVFNGAVGTPYSYPAFAALRDGSRLTEGLAAWGGITASLNADGETDLVSGAIVTGGFFDLLGVTAAHGRLLGPADDRIPGAHPVAVISHRLWQARFGGRSDIVGREVRLNGRTFVVVGVARPDFPGPELGVLRDLYVTTMMQALIRPPRAGFAGEMDPDLLGVPTSSWLFVIGLLAPGVSPQQAGAELGSLYKAFADGVSPVMSRRAQPPTLVPLDEGDPEQRARLRSVAVLLGAVVFVVLLIGCANVANLLLSKAAARRKEIAIRIALGASRWRIVRQLLTESVVLAFAGGAFGLLLAWMLIQAFQAAPPPAGALPLAVDFAVDRRVLGFSLVLSMLTGLAFGVVPALQVSRPELTRSLKDESFVPDAVSRRLDFKKGLVVAEVALSVLLLIAAGLFIRSLRAVQQIDPGVAAAELVSAPLNINLLRYTTDQGRGFYRRVVERVEQIPGVRSASVARVAVLTGGARTVRLIVEGRPDPTEADARTGPDPTALANVVGPGFFRTMGIALLRGRDFDDQDIEGRPNVALVSESLAREFFPGEDPLGRRINTGGTGDNAYWSEIVGVVRDSKYAALAETSAPVVYLPVAQRHETGMTLYVRSSGVPSMLVGELRHVLRELEPNLAVPGIQAMSTTIGAALYAPRMGATLLSAFGLVALMLASFGVYGVLAFSMSRRTREIGIRMALGADRRGVLGLVIGEGMALVGVGLAVGLLAGVYLTASLERFLFDVSARDVTTFATVPWVLAAVALVACYLPARRAMRVDPMTALRDS